MKEAASKGIYVLPFSQAFHIKEQDIFADGKLGPYVTDLPRYKTLFNSFNDLSGLGGFLYDYRAGFADRVCTSKGSKHYIW